MDLIVQGFIAEKEALKFYNSKAVINLVFAFYYDDEDETEFDFVDDSSSYFFRVYDEREGREIKDFRYKKQYGNWDGTNFVYKDAASGEIAYKKVIQDKGTIVSGWLNESTQQSISKVYESPYILVQTGAATYYQIVVENGSFDYYFTEKIIDCFVTGVIPIYWGCSNIGSFYNKGGIIQVHNADDIIDVINNLSPNFYKEHLNIINENYNLALEYKDYTGNIAKQIKHIFKQNNLI
jgi:hypothetical protein